jgi:hypothetical protein
MCRDSVSRQSRLPTGKPTLKRSSKMYTLLIVALALCVGNQIGKD